MSQTEASPAEAAVAAIRSRIGDAMPATYLGPEGGYLRLRRRSPRPVDISVSCCGLPIGSYSVQICMDEDPLAIVFDDECDLDGLVDVCELHLREPG